MLLATVAAALTVACPSNTANDLRVHPPGSQLITVAASSTTTTHATLRIWRRSDGCWVAASC